MMSSIKSMFSGDTIYPILYASIIGSLINLSGDFPGLTSIAVLLSLQAIQHLVGRELKNYDTQKRRNQ